MLYRIKLDYESKGEASELATLFSRACRELEDNVGYSSRSHHRLRLLDEQISELRTVLGCDELSPGECHPACPGEDGVPFAAMSLQNSQPQAANADSTAIPKEHGGRSLLQDAIARSRPKSIGTHSCRTVKHEVLRLSVRRLPFIRLSVRRLSVLRLFILVVSALGLSNLRPSAHRRYKPGRAFTPFRPCRRGAAISVPNILGPI